VVAGSDLAALASKVLADMVGRPLTAADSDLFGRLTVEAYEGDDLKEGVAAFSQRCEPAFRTGKVNDPGCLRPT
jgi:enoyl-CoA hydratase